MNTASPAKAEETYPVREITERYEVVNTVDVLLWRLPLACKALTAHSRIATIDSNSSR